jgi:hypothetical protein
VSQVAGLVAVEPLLLRQQEATGPDADKVVRQRILKESGVAALFGRGPLAGELRQMLFCVFAGHAVHRSPPFGELDIGHISFYIMSNEKPDVN